MSSYWSQFQSTPVQPTGRKAKFYKYTLEIFPNRLTLLNETGNVAIGLTKVNNYGYAAPAANGYATTRKEYEIIPDADFECGGNFVIFADGSDMGVLTRTKTTTQPAEVSIGVLIAITPTTVPTPPQPQTIGFEWKGASATPTPTSTPTPAMSPLIPTPQQEYFRQPSTAVHFSDDYPSMTRKRPVVLDESPDGPDGPESIFPPNFF